MPTLVIVESPGKTKKINAILGDGFVVRASFGHIRDLPSGGGSSGSSPVPGIDIDRGWVPDYQVLSGKERVARELRGIGASGTVYLATDLDREGEAIAWHLRDLLGGDEDRFRRVTFSEITAPAIREAFERPRGIDYGLVDAQQARRFLDRVVGYCVSPLLSRRLSASLSAGRVQSVALRILVDRDRQIGSFRSAEFYGLDVALPVSGVEGLDAVTASVVGDDASVRRFDDRADADALAARISASEVVLRSVEQADTLQRPKPPFTTSTMQQSASTVLKLSVSDTMKLAQSLYEAGRITYMRSDAVFVAAAAQDAARGWLQAAFGADAVPDQAPSYAAKSGAQEAHEAVRPTDPAAGPETVSDPAQSALYDLIRRRLLASQMHPARIRRTTWTLDARTPDGPVSLVAKGRTVVAPGFHLVFPPPSAVDEPPPIPPLPEGSSWPPGLPGVEVTTSWTKPPPRYTEASLVAELESAGVGRPSTYANILRVLLDRTYVLLDGRVFVVTPLGRLVCDRLVRHFPAILDVGFTAELEKSLDVVAAGGLPYRQLLDTFYATLCSDLDVARSDPAFASPHPSQLSEPCSSCSQRPILRFDGGQLMLFCPGCRRSATLSWAPKKARRAPRRAESGEKAVTEQVAADQRLQTRCPECGGALQRWKVSAGGYLHLCQAWPNCSGAVLEKGFSAPAAAAAAPPVRRKASPARRAPARRRPRS